MNELLPWVPHALAIAALGYTIFNNRGAKHEKKLAAIEQSIATVNNAVVTMQRTIEQRVDRAEDRVTKIEAEMQHLPDKDLTHRLELSIESLKGEVRTLGERVRPIGAMADRMQEAILEKVAHG